jgi:hypothetical protein
MPIADLFQRWHIDILGGLPTSKNKYKYVLLVVDSFSKWSEAFPLYTQEATEVASVLFRECICRYGAPNVLVSDRGQNFLSKLVKALCELFQITRYYTSSYRPLMNGSVERMNSVILQSLRLYCTGKQDDWPELLPSIMMAYRMTPATQSTKYSPFFLLFGREMRLPIDTSLTPKSTLSAEFKTHLAQVLQNLEIARKIAAENTKLAQEKYKNQYDKHSQPADFKPAERVWLYCTKVPPGMAPKLHRKWVGPYYITLLGPNNTYKLRRCSDNREVKVMVNATRLKHYFDPADRPTNPPPGYENLTEPLNDEEMPPEQPSQHDNLAESTNTPSSKGKQPLNKNSKAKNSQKKSTPLNKPSNQNSTQTNEPSTSISSDHQLLNSNQNQSQQNTLKQQIQPSTSKDLPSTTPTQKSSEPKTISANDIDKIISCQRTKDTLYYRIKWKDPQKPSTWEYATSIPEIFIREYHANKTMSGKKRKKPLKHHKFFDNLPNVNLVSFDSTWPKPRSSSSYVTGYTETYTLSNQHTIYNDKGTLCTGSILFPISERKEHMQPYLNTLFDLLKHADYEIWHSNTGILDSGQKIEGKMIRGVVTYDLSHPVETTYFKVFHTASRHPVWLPFSQAPIKLVRQLLFRIANKIKCNGQLFKSNKTLNKQF